MDVNVSNNPCHSSLSDAEPQSVTEGQARQTRSSTAGAEVPSFSISDARNLSSRAEEPDVIILESTIVSARVEESSDEMVVQEDPASHPNEEKSLVGKKNR